jgi:hypothetical protein
VEDDFGASEEVRSLLAASGAVGHGHIRICHD